MFVMALFCVKVGFSNSSEGLGRWEPRLVRTIKPT